MTSEDVKVHLERTDIDALSRVIASGQYTMKDEVFSFEDEFARCIGRRFGIMVNSAHSAALIAVGSLLFKAERPLAAGDEVIVPALSWPATLHPLQQYGLALRFVDVEAATLTVDAGRLEQALTPRTRMVLGTSFLGNPAALGALRAFADAHGLLFLEDAADAPGAELDGRKAGTVGDLSTFAFSPAHHVTTMEGGMVLTDDIELADLNRALRAHGWTRDLSRTSPIFEKRYTDFFEAYRFILPGYNLRPIELEGALGRSQLARLPDTLAAYRRNAARFAEAFADTPRFVLQSGRGAGVARGLSVVAGGDAAFDVMAAVEALAQAGITACPLADACLLRHGALRHVQHSVAGSVANALNAADRGLYILNRPDLPMDFAERARAVLTTVCERS